MDFEDMNRSELIKLIVFLLKEREELKKDGQFYADMADELQDKQELQERDCPYDYLYYGGA